MSKPPFLASTSSGYLWLTGSSGFGLIRNRARFCGGCDRLWIEEAGDEHVAHDVHTGASSGNNATPAPATPPQGRGQGVAWSILECARRTRLQMFPPSLLVIPQGWGLIDLPLRASNEGSPRPRVARAQKINRLHPLPVPRAEGRPGYPSPSPRVGPDQKGTSF